MGHHNAGQFSSRPAREIAIEVRQRATADPANYDKGLAEQADSAAAHDQTEHPVWIAVWIGLLRRLLHITS